MTCMTFSRSLNNRSCESSPAQPPPKAIRYYIFSITIFVQDRGRPGSDKGEKPSSLWVIHWPSRDLSEACIDVPERLNSRIRRGTAATRRSYNIFPNHARVYNLGQVFTQPASQLMDERQGREAGTCLYASPDYCHIWQLVLRYPHSSKDRGSVEGDPTCAASPGLVGPSLETSLISPDETLSCIQQDPPCGLTVGVTGRDLAWLGKPSIRRTD